MPLEEYVLILQAIVLTPLALVVVVGAIAGAIFAIVLLLGARATAWAAWPILIGGVFALLIWSCEQL